ncbi:transposable element Tcb2 transposase [Trichonephila clavipes]|nr:transposable element Tcb2 transposase [Trichonephila clavipes]
MEAEWSAGLVARQLGSSDCVVRRCWDQWIREISFTRRPGSERPRQTSYCKKCTRAANCFIGCHSVLTSTHRCLHLEWCHTRGNCTVAKWNQVVFNDESSFNLRSDDNHVRMLSPCDERLNPAFTLQRHTAPTAGVMVWGAVAYKYGHP